MLSPDRNERPPSMSAVLTVLDASAP